jgi:hypothetical protein
MICGCLAATACGGGGGTSTAGTPPAGTPTTTAKTTPTAQPTPTAKPKPKSLPQLTLQYCNQLMSLAEMNALMKPPAPATTIVPTNGGTGGACNYEATKTNIPLIIYFFVWNGPDPIPQADIQAALSQAAGNNLTITTATPVSGIADQAEYLEATGSGDGLHAVMHIFYVLEGPFIFDCFTYTPLSAGFLATQNQLQQCATQVDSRL